MKYGIARWTIWLSSLAGFIIMSYLTYIHFAKVSSFCNFSKGISCDLVTTSIYSEIFGIPVSLLGMIYFALAAYFDLAKKNHSGIILMTLASIFPSLYLSFAELFFIKSICILCESSKILILIILAASTLELRRMNQKISRDYIINAVVLGLLGVAIMYFVNSNILF